MFLLAFLFYIVHSKDPYWPKSFLETLGGVNSDMGRSVQQTSDGGFIVSGETSSFGDFVALLSKFHWNGTLEWASILESTYSGRSVQQTSDGGYIVSGDTYSFGAVGYSDVFLAKYYSNGSLEWASRQGGSGSTSDHGRSVQQTLDGGYVVTGDTLSFGAGKSDVLLSKYLSNGTLEWSSTLGDVGDDKGTSVQQTDDDGFVVTGSISILEDGPKNVLLVKYFANGSMEWASSFGGSNDDVGNSVQQTLDGGYIVAGYAKSFGVVGSYDILLASIAFPAGN